MTSKVKEVRTLTGILEAYAKQNGFSNLKWYTDDGFSGANFQSPGFQSMLADIEAGLVGTVIVKDDCVILELNSESPENTGLCDVSSVF